MKYLKDKLSKILFGVFLRILGFAVLLILAFILPVAAVAASVVFLINPFLILNESLISKFDIYGKL